ncbi:MAG: vitamin B12 dependent-methionine synthase activation domain-containing protein [Victivallales bacterium]|nr:vitamin B12 dependent-methionine synthase activation domain-containing protein [Victivallales bacterium]
MAVEVLNAIPLRPPLPEIMRRLGYNRHRNEVMAERQRRLIDAAIAAGFALRRPRGCRIRLEPIAVEKNLVRLADGTVFASGGLAALVQDSHALWLAAVTVGAEISRAGAALAAAGDGTAAAIYDAVGSETADAAMDWLQRYQAAQLTRSGEKLTRRRFSPGYSDLGLEAQRDIFRLLHLEDFGMSLTDRLFMMPEKSVTAFAGIEFNPPIPTEGKNNDTTGI